MTIKPLDQPNATGIYAIHCRINDFIYIGSAGNCRGKVIGIRNRAYRHRGELRKGKHHSPTLQAHWNKYGEDAFDMYALELCEPSQCQAFEQSWLDIRGVGYANRSYNTLPNAYSTSGGIISEETKLKRLEARMKSSGRLFEATSPDGEKYIVSNLSEFCRQHNLHNANLYRVIRGQCKHHRGWVCRYLDQETPVTPRYKRWSLISPKGERFETDNLKSFASLHGLNPNALSHVAKGNYQHHRGWQVNSV